MGYSSTRLLAGLGTEETWKLRETQTSDPRSMCTAHWVGAPWKRTRLKKGEDSVKDTELEGSVGRPSEVTERADWVYGNRIPKEAHPEVRN